MTTTLPPPVAVLMAVHNGEPYLGEAVDSILGQTFGDFEFLVVDDGSSDGTADILSDFARRDSRIRIVRNSENVGLTKSLNIALSLTDAAFLARMDADDISLPGRLGKQLDYMRSHADCVVVGCRILSIDEDGDPICRERQGTTHDEIEKILFHGFGGAIPHPTAMMRGEVVKACGGYREEFPVAQDLDLWLRMAEHGRLANLPDVLLKYRRHFAAVGWQRNTEQRQVAEQILRDACQRRGVAEPSDLRRYFLDPKTRFEQELEWSRQAAHDGFHRTAWKHACRAAGSRPWNCEAWRAIGRVLVYRSGLRSVDTGGDLA